MSHEDLVNNEFAGRKILTDFEEIPDSFELDWRGTGSVDGEGDEALFGDGYVTLDNRDYSPDQDGDDDECKNWRIQTSLSFTAYLGFIDSIGIDASISCSGDSGLGDCYPEEEWTFEDYDLARKFLNLLTSKPSDEK